MKENTRSYPLHQRLLSFAMAAVLVFSNLPVQTRAVTDAENYLVDHTATVDDPDTVSRPVDVYGDNTENAGKVTVGKSVSDTAVTLTYGDDSETFTPGTDNFIVTVSQTAQVMGLASESSVPVDVVFVLDTSGSMGTNNTDKPTGRAEAMVEAANAAIASLMAANKNNRVGVVAFSGQGAGYGTSNSAAANVLSPLAHYTEESATNHLRWVSSDGDTPSRAGTSTGIGTSYNYIQGRGTDAGRRNGGNGGTNIHAGVALGAQMLTSATTTELVDGKQVTRMPFLVVLSDGQPTFSASNAEWYDPSMTSQQGPGNGAYSGNGFLPALTAAYYKGKITEHYYGDTASEKNRCYIYTIGVGLDSLTGDNKALAQITMDPKTYTSGTYAETNAASYWNYGNTHDANTKDATYGWKTYWESFNKTPAADFSVEVDGGSWQDVWVGEGEEGTGRPQREDYYDRWGRFDRDAYEDAVEAWEEANYERVWVDGTFTISADTINATKSYVNGVGYNGGIAYNDDYFNANETSEITEAFNKALQEIQLKAMSSPTHVDATHGEDFSGYVTFTDPIGEYMEVKQMYGVLADGYFYQGKRFAEYVSDWDNAPEEFKTQLLKVLKERCNIAGASVTDAQLVSFLKAAAGSANQANYDETTGAFDNSIVWWGSAFTAPNEEDEQVQWLGFADNDSIEYIEEQKAAGNIPADADYVCRSYYFYGTAGGAAGTDSNNEYLHFVVRVQRSLTAPYQQTVVISAPASLLSVEKVMITETTDATGNVTYSAVVTEAEPARVVYEVGLRSDINAFNVDKILAEDAAYLNETATFNGTAVNTNYDAAAGTYSFYTNDWNRSAAEDSHHRAMAKATFDAASDNSFYTYTEDTLIYVKNGDSYELYTGTEKPVGEGYYYARDVYDWDGAALADGAYAATKRTVYIPVTLPDSDVIKASGSNWVVAKGTYKASSLVSANEDVKKRSNDTQTAAYVVHPHRTDDDDANNSHYTVLLGNNGKLTLKSADTKTVDITRPDDTVITDADGKVVMVGDILTYTIQVINGGDTDADAAVTDTIPTGTEYVPGSADNDGEYDANTGVITWTIEDIPAGKYVEVSFQVKVTEAALSGDLDVVSIDNAASVTLTNEFAYTTNTTQNPPEGKKVVDTDGDTITGDVAIPDVLVYRIRWHNDADGTADVTINDVIPAGTSYVAGSASHGGVYDAENKTITWTLEDEAAGASGVVSFRVNVNAAAGDTIENDAEIKIGNNDPRVTNKTSAEVAKGDLVLSKAVVADSKYPDALTQEFTLNITEIGLGMNGTYTMLKNGTAVEGGITFTNGVASVKIKNGDKIEIQGITAGAIISVVEASKTGFTAEYTTVAGDSSAEGRVTIVANTDVSVDVENTYSPAPVTFELKGTKTLQTTLPLTDTTFGFTAYPCTAEGTADANGEPLTGEVTVSSTSQTAAIIFASEVFQTTGVYHYLISEINGGVTGITYAQNQYLLTVVVTDNGSGILQAAATLKQRAGSSGDFGSESVYTDTGVAFTNTYAPKQTQLPLEADKALTGRDLKAGEFSFVVTEEVNGRTVVVTTGTNDDDGNVTFRPITYTTPGDHTYVITEVDGGLKGVQYSTASYTVTVKVEDVNGQLVATPTYPAGGVKFENTYTPDGITVTLNAEKALNNQSGDTSRVLKEKEFNFVVKDSQGNSVATGMNTDEDGDGVYDDIKFTPIGYTVSDAGKTYTYTVSEVIPDISYDPYMDYDETSFTVTVQVNYDSDKGELSPVVAYAGLQQDEVPVFTNTQYPSSIEVTPTGSKTTTVLSGSTANIPGNATFAFTIIDVATGKEAGVGVGTANGTFLFSKLTYTQANTYRYWIRETHAGQTSHGIKYDSTVYLMEIEVTKTNGKLEASDPVYYALKENGDPANAADYTTVVDVPTFKNEYDAKGQISITAKKVLENRTLNAGDFAFRLVRQNVDKPHEVTGVVDASGSITFATLYYDLSEFADGQTTKTIHYEMSEVVPATGKIPGVTYDERVRDVYITITHNADGTISAKVTDAEGNALTKDGNALAENDSNVTFTNIYAATEGTSAQFSAVKALTGRTLKDGEFSFQLFHLNEEGKEVLVDTTTNDAYGNIRFTRTYATTVLTNGAESREIKYVIREVDNNLSGVDYSKASPVWVKVTVTDNKETGKLESSVRYYSDAGFTQEITDLTAVKFVNAYDPQNVTFKPEATKVLENRQMTYREFAFVVTEGSTVVSTGWSMADGTIEFTPIGYTAEGEHTYTISEVKGNLPQVTYTDATYTLTVTVVDDTEAGKLVATGVYEGLAEGEIPTFTNTYIPSPASVQLQATKKLENHPMEQGEFSFVVRDANNKIVATGGNAAAAANETVAVTFSNIGFTHDMLGNETSKAFIYSISEQPTTHGGVEIDPNTYYAKVVLTLNSDGTLSTSVTYHSAKSCTEESKLSGIPAFVNSYEPASAEVTLYADKTLINKDLADGEFTFTLQGEGVSDSKTNTAGRATFDKLTFTAPGTYTYTIAESVTDSAKADRYTLDNAFKVIVTVTDDQSGRLVAAVTYHEISPDGTYDAAVNLGGAEFINYYTAPALTVPLSTQIGASKTVQTVGGITYSPAGFQFAVTDTTGNVIYGRDAEGKEVKMIGVSGADGKIVFPSFYFGKAGEYHYWISEMPSDKTGITDDLRTWEVHILVRYNEQTGLLYVDADDVQTYLVGRTAADGSDPAFVNVYEPDPIKLNLTATKVLEGRELRDREFLFYLMEGNTIVAQGYNDVKGNVTFELTYTKESIGTHSYSVKELVPENGLGGVTYNDTVYAAVTVRVSHLDDQHKLVATVGNTDLADGATVATGVTITNKYSADGTSVKVYANKVINGGKPMAAKDYSFTLVNPENSKEVYTAVNDGSGKIEFTLDFDKVGVYTYTMSEVEGTIGGITYDDSTFTVTVTVEDDLNGKLHASVAYEDDTIPTFVNEYKASYTTARIEASKTLVGNKLLTADEYTFELERSDGAKVTTTNDAKGNVVFNLRYDEAGTYTYILREKAGDAAGTTYDDAEYKVTVKVTDGMNGKLEAEVSYDGLATGKIPSFVNTYQGKAVPVKITATKTLTGKPLTADAYTFTLTNQDNAKDVITAKNDAEGKVVFELTFTEVGTYTYILAEAAGTDANTAYDKTAYTVTIKVTDDLKGNLKAEVTGGTDLKFSNVYTPSAITVELEGEKKLSGRDMVKDEFSFEVRNSEGDVVAKAKNTADGKLKFSAIELKAVGKYTFTVTEVKGSEKGMIYDTDKFTVTVEVSNVDGTLKAEVSYPKGGVVFKNTYKNPDPTNPGTGDDTPLMLMIGMMLVSGSAVIALLIPKKKRARRA